MLVKKRTQTDEVLATQEIKPETETFSIRLPGIDSLHTRPVEDIAEALANVLKSRQNIIELNWKIGESISLTIKN